LRLILTTYFLHVKLEFQRRTLYLLTEMRDLLSKQRIDPLPDNFTVDKIQTTEELERFNSKLEDKDLQTKLVSFSLK